MQFNKKQIVGLFIIAILLGVIFWETSPTLSSNLGIGSNASDTDETDSNRQNGSSVEEVQPSYRRGRDFERWAYPNRTVSLLMYMGPRFVRHYATGEFADLVFEDHYASEGYYLVQNSYVGLKIYDNKTVMYNPDMEYVTVDNEQIKVQVYDANASSWTDVNLGMPSLRVSAKNETAIVITRVFDNAKGKLEASYIVWSGAYLKHQISFVSYSSEKQTYRLAHIFDGIRGTKLSYIKNMESIDEVSNVTNRMEFNACFFKVQRGSTDILGVNLYDLGSWNYETREWKAVDLEKVLMEPVVNDLKAEIYYGNRTLRQKESISIDPLITTFQVQLGIDDTYENYWYYYPDPNINGVVNEYNAPQIRFGKWYELEYYRMHIYRTYLRWQLLIPDGGILTAAYVHIKAQTSKSIEFTTNIKLIDSSNCQPFNEVNPWELPTTGNVQWSLGQWDPNTWYTSPDISSLVSAFLNNQDYTLGNYVGLKIDEGNVGNPGIGSQNHYKEGYSANYGSAYAAKLEVRFSYPYDEAFVEPLENWSFEDASGWSVDNLFLKMDEGEGKKAYDNGPNGNDGSITADHGIIYGATWTDGKYNKALNFDGVNDYVRVPNSASLNPTSITVMFWVKIDAIPTIQDGVRKEFSYILEWNTAGRLRPHVYVDGAWRIAESDAGKVVTGVWQHHAMTYDENTHMLKGFVNGQEVCSLTLSGLTTYQIASSAGDVYIGSDSAGNNQFLDGVNDEVRIYKQALNIPEVFSCFSGIDVREELAAEWKFDEGNGESAADTHMWITGMCGEALFFDGLDDCVDVPHHSSLTSPDITVDLWYKPQSNGHIVDKRSWDSSYRGYFIRQDNDGQITFEFWDGSFPAADAIQATGFSYGLWHHLVAELKSGSYMRIYRNGVKVSEKTTTKSLPAGDSKLRIGCAEWSAPPYWFKGTIDEVRINDDKISIAVDDTTYMHGKNSWRVEGPNSQDAVVSQLLDKEVVEYIRNRKPNQQRGVCFSFWYKPDDAISSGEKNKARAEILYYDGSWHTVSGDTIKPNDDSKWWHALVYASLPTNTEQAKVRIAGTPYSGEGFKAWIDLASLSVYYYKSDTTSPCGDATLTTNIYYSNAIPHPEWDGFVSLGFGIAAKTKSGYSVGKLRDLTVELLPNNGSATTQDGRLTILYLTQTNSRNLTIRDLPLSRAYIGFDAETFVTNYAWWTVGAIITTAITAGWGTFGYVTAANLIIGAGLTGFKSSIRMVELQHPFASGGTSYKAYETLDYSDHLGYPYSDRIDNASATYYFDWRFKTDSDDVFAIKVSATVEWYDWAYDPYYGGYHWIYADKTELSTIITIANYWQ